MLYRLLHLFRFTAVAALLGALLPGRVMADADLIRQAERAGYVAPLAELLTTIKNQFPGRVLKVDLAPENEEGDLPASWIYELKVLQSDGLVLKILFDAKTLVPLEVNGEPYGAQNVDENR